MTRREIAAIAGLVAVAACLLAWATTEGERQRRESEAAVAAHGAVLAASLGPGLAAAETAALAVDDLVAARLLDGARFLALETLPTDDLEGLVASGTLDAIVYLDGSGRVESEAGVDLPAELLTECASALQGPTATRELLIGPQPEEGGLFVGAVDRPGGGAVVAAIAHEHGSAFPAALEVERLLEGIVGAGGVLYLQLTRHGDGTVAGATWDDGPLPAAVTDEDPTAPGIRRELRGRSVFEVSVPIPRPAGGSASLRVGIDATPLDQASGAALRRTTLVGVALLLATLAGASYTVVRGARLRERARAAERLAESEASRRRNERLAAAGALTAGLAHEVRSPLNAISLAAQRIERRAEASKATRTLAGRIRTEVSRLDDTLRGFLDLARPLSGRRDPVDLADLAREVAELLEPESAPRGVRLRITGSALARVDPAAVRRALLNLLRNAIQASDPGGEVEASAALEEGWAIVRIRDRGRGLQAPDAERLLEPFVTTRSDGTGLGLPMARRVAEEHGGSLRLVGRAGGGAEAQLRLPTAERRLVAC